LVHAWRSGEEQWAPVQAETLADSISVGQPRNGLKALRAVRESEGVLVDVSDEEILSAERELASHGVFGEPAGVAAVAGVQSARWSGIIGPEERVLHVVTGSGLKDVKGAVAAAASEPLVIEPALEAVQEHVEASRR
jgi:threonine synthase